MESSQSRPRASELTLQQSSRNPQKLEEGVKAIWGRQGLKWERGGKRWLIGHPGKESRAPACEGVWRAAVQGHWLVSGEECPVPGHMVFPGVLWNGEMGELNAAGMRQQWPYLSVCL